jgi:hypothetical protein
MYSTKAQNQLAEGMGKESSPERTSARRYGSRDASHSELLFLGGWVGGRLHKLYRREGGIGEGKAEPADAGVSS